MEKSYIGELDFTLLCRLWKDHKELFQMVNFKDGQHALLKVNFNARKQVDEKGHTHYLAAKCKQSDRKDGVNYFIGSNFKPTDGGKFEIPTSTSSEAVENNLPF